MKCPKCNCEMLIVERKGIQLDYCPSCRGIWFDNMEINCLQEAYPEVVFTAPEICFLKIKKDSKERTYNCPRCGKKMDKVVMNNRPPLLDMCETCGFWFDEGELTKYIESNLIYQKSNTIITFLGEVLNKKGEN